MRVGLAHAHLASERTARDFCSLRGRHAHHRTRPESRSLFICGQSGDVAARTHIVWSSVQPCKTSCTPNVYYGSAWGFVLFFRLFFVLFFFFIFFLRSFMRICLQAAGLVVQAQHHVQVRGCGWVFHVGRSQPVLDGKKTKEGVFPFSFFSSFFFFFLRIAKLESV